MVEEDFARGRALRKTTPRRSLAQLVPAQRSAIEILVEQNSNRVPGLVPLRFARMLTDPFSFFRGSAAVMAADLAAGPSSGVDVLCSGDAHISNFGVFAAPHRELVFDLNDFDEAGVAPAEWDVKRLVTSAVIGGRHAGYPEEVLRDIAESVVGSYRDGLHIMLDMDVLDRYYLRLEPERYAQRVSGDLAAIIERTAQKARKRTSGRVLKRITEPGPGGALRLREAPPVLAHVEPALEAALNESFDEYLTVLPVDVALLVSRFRVADLAARVVGVGSVGTRSYLMILTGPNGAPLVLQLKEANRSVLEEYGGRIQPEILQSAQAALGHGHRVVSGQRILQAMSDIFLGTMRTQGRDFYVRQFQDMKGSFDTDAMSPAVFGEYVRACALALARGHAQSVNAALLRGYVGSGATLGEAIVAWSYAYAEKALDDYHQLRAAAADGEIEVAPDPLR